MTILLIRSVLLYIFVLVAAKGLGPCQLSQLQPYELVGLLMISEMGSLALQSSSLPLLYSLLPIAAVSLLLVLIAAVDLKSERLRRFLNGQPVAVIEQGRLCQEALARLRMNLCDLEELCRAQGYFDLTDVDWAVLETNGQLSVLPKTAKRPLTVGDVQNEPPREGLARLLVRDGKADAVALKAAGYDERWLEKRLQEAGLELSATFVAGVDAQGGFFCQAREGRR